jgi:hypothetical protein
MDFCCCRLSWIVEFSVAWVVNPMLCEIFCWQPRFVLFFFAFWVVNPMQLLSCWVELPTLCLFSRLVKRLASPRLVFIARCLVGFSCPTPNLLILPGLSPDKLFLVFAWWELFGSYALWGVMFYGCKSNAPVILLGWVSNTLFVFSSGQMPGESSSGFYCPLLGWV